MTPDELVESSLFDVEHYLGQLDDEVPARDAAAHYLVNEPRSEHSPHPLFDPAHYRRQAGPVDHPLADFLGDGWRRFDPHQLFDCSHYLEHAPDVAQVQYNPLVHWVRHGWRERRPFHRFFSIDYYVSQMASLLGDSGECDPLVHYVTAGWRRGLDPHPLFSTDYYLAHSPDVADAGENPLAHFDASGGQELRVHHPMFDPATYRAKTGTDGVPLAHFLDHGGTVDSTPLFNTRWYLAQSPDARHSALPPLIHWIVEGAPRGIPPRSGPFDELIADLLPTDPAGAQMLLRHRSSDPGWPGRKAFAVRFRFGDEPDVGHPATTTDVLVTGGVPGAWSAEAGLVGAEAPERPLTVRHGRTCSIIRDGSGLVAGVVERPPLERALLVRDSFVGTEATWLLEQLPALLAASPSFEGWPIVVTRAGLRPHVRSLTERLLHAHPVIFVEPGVTRSIRVAEVVWKPDALAVARQQPRSDDQHPPVLLVDPDDPFDDDGRGALMASLLPHGFVAIDVRWGAELLVDVLSRTNHIVVAGAGPLAALTAPAGARIDVLAGGHDDPPWTARARDTGLNVRVHQLPARSPLSRRDDVLLLEPSKVGETLTSALP